MPAVARSTKAQILLTAERMIADHGVDGVSMRQIGTEVGSGNNSAVLYHFGSKEKLVEAIFDTGSQGCVHVAPSSSPNELPRISAAGSSARSSPCSSRATSPTATPELRGVDLAARRRGVQAPAEALRKGQEEYEEHVRHGSALSKSRCARTGSLSSWT